MLLFLLQAEGIIASVAFVFFLLLSLLTSKDGRIGHG
jgi:hypothetical protein